MLWRAVAVLAVIYCCLHALRMHLTGPVASALPSAKTLEDRLRQRGKDHISTLLRQQMKLEGARRCPLCKTVGFIAGDCAAVNEVSMTIANNEMTYVCRQDLI